MAHTEGVAARVKSLLVLARRDHGEAMRVAAGLTIFGHSVDLVFMTGPVEETEHNAAMAELLEIAGVAPRTTVEAMAGELPLLDGDGLAEAIRGADAVLSL